MKVIANGVEDQKADAVVYGFTEAGKWTLTRGSTRFGGTYCLAPGEGSRPLDLVYDPSEGDRGKNVAIYELKGDTLTI